MASITRRQIDGIWYLCRDTGCQDFQAAKENRARISQGFALEYWHRLEQVLEELSPRQNLPEEFSNLNE